MIIKVIILILALWMVGVLGRVVRKDILGLQEEIKLTIISIMIASAAIVNMWH